MLQAFKAAVTSDPYSSLSSWSTGSNACTWSGVSCNSLGYVDSLDLEYDGLVASLPSSFAYLNQLTSLSLRDNSFTGTLPSSWAALTALQSLDLTSNQITSTLPPAWSALSALTKLNLRSNLLISTVPAGYSAWSALFQLVLDSNVGLCGTLPSAISSLVSYTNTSIGAACPSPPPPPPSTGFALLSLKSGFSADPRDLLVNWTTANQGSVCSNWFGVTCTGSTIISIDLSYAQLQVCTRPATSCFAPHAFKYMLLCSSHLRPLLMQGSLASQLLYVTSLQSLVLAGNRCGGRGLPVWLECPLTDCLQRLQPHGQLAKRMEHAHSPHGGRKHPRN